MKLNVNVKNNIAIVVGNFLDHCDTHMYGLLAPFIAQLFFGGDDAVTAIIKAHGIALFGIVARPLGAVLFGKLAYRVGPLASLRLSLIGVSIATFVIGLLPTYAQVGYLAPIFLLIARAFQSFCASGEGSIAGLYLTANNPKRRSLFASIYSLSTILGICFASSIVEIVNSRFDLDVYWRIVFFVGFFTSIAGIYIRVQRYESMDIKSDTVKQKNTYGIIKNNTSRILRIAIVYGFSYTSYPVAFTLINSILPVIKNISIAQILEFNTKLLLLDGAMIVAAGYIISFLNTEKLIIACIFALAIAESVLFWIVPAADIETINLMRVLVVILGVFLMLVKKVWIADITDDCDEEKYLINGLGQSIGIETLGRTIVVLSLFYFNFAGNFMLSGIYVMLLALCAIYSIYSYPKSIKY